MKVMTFEGTPEEFKSVAHLFGRAISEVQPTDDISIPTIDKVDAIRAMLTRIPIRNGQRALYSALADGRLEYGELLIRTERTGIKMAGLLGALGGRVDNTPEIHQAGLPGNASAVIHKETIEGIRYFELTTEAIEALKLEKII